MQFNATQRDKRPTGLFVASGNMSMQRLAETLSSFVAPGDAGLWARRGLGEGSPPDPCARPFPHLPLRPDFIGSNVLHY